MKNRSNPVFERYFLWVCAFAVFVLAPLSYVWFDRPIARLVHEDIMIAKDFFAALTHLVDGVVIVAVWVGLLVLVRMFQRRALSDHLKMGLRASAGLAVSTLCIKFLKYAFGRTWPETWIDQNPSFFNDGVYGFFPFHGGKGWSAFPSGHTAAIVSVAATLWILAPQGRILYALAVVAVVTGLLGADYHWLSDIIVGGAVAAVIGVAAARIGQGRLAYSSGSRS